MFEWIFSNIGINMGQGFEYKVQFMKKIPLPSITKKDEPIVQQIEMLVDKIISAKKENKYADTREWEREIDRLVYRLYDLTEEEIKIIEQQG
jgi:hypothetical protein